MLFRSIRPACFDRPDTSDAPPAVTTLRPCLSTFHLSSVRGVCVHGSGYGPANRDRGDRPEVRGKREGVRIGEGGSLIWRGGLHASGSIDRCSLFANFGGRQICPRLGRRAGSGRRQAATGSGPTSGRGPPRVRRGGHEKRTSRRTVRPPFVFPASSSSYASPGLLLHAPLAPHYTSHCASHT